MNRWLAVLALMSAHTAFAAPIEGTVARVIDGDTLVLQSVSGAPLTVRVRGIDAPEICQAHGPQAKQALEEMVLNQAVRLLASGRDEHGRTVAKLMKDSLDVGDRMVRDGHAWSHRYRNDRGPYVAGERMALALRRGLHVDPAALQPREFRKRHGACPPPPA